MSDFTHLDQKKRPRMVDVSEKATTLREAAATGTVLMKPSTLEALEAGSIAKGNVFDTAKIAGIMAAKRTSDIIPLCHPLELTGIDISFSSDQSEGRVTIAARVKTVGRTGVEMEAMTAVSAAALTIYDMCKAVDREIIIGDIRLDFKSGGKSGTFVRTCGPGEGS
ncbi:MAG: cyclic pyranopterin monophosphate synthase MoaC [Deltaproteobacteria bacterium]|nr:cyclic pyranopterin monophosphate synthase MoaC [Deltaproteobacteria bacterium]